MDPRNLRQSILDHVETSDGARRKLSCERARQLAAELGVEVRLVGDICREEGVKIVHCQLGCFGDRDER